VARVLSVRLDPEGPHSPFHLRSTGQGGATTTAVVAGGPAMMATATTTAAAAAAAAAATTMLGARLQQQLWRQRQQQCPSSSGVLFRWPLPTQRGPLPVLATAASAADVCVPVGKRVQPWRLRCISEPLAASTSSCSSGGGATGSG
jgi:hypothetical protein